MGGQRCLFVYLFVSNIEGEIHKAKKQIAAYKEDLQNARMHRQEYDALAKVCDVETLYLMDTFCMHLNNVWVEGGDVY